MYSTTISAPSGCPSALEAPIDVNEAGVPLVVVRRMPLQRNGCRGSASKTSPRCSWRRPLEESELLGDRFDAELHQELQLIARLVILHSSDDGGLRVVRLRPVRLAYGGDECLDVAALPVPHPGADWPTVTDVECRIVREALAQLRDVREPLAIEAVCEVAVRVVVDLVAEEDDLRVGSEDPGAVVGRLARPEIYDGELNAVEGHALTVADRRVREDARTGPLVSEHRPHDRILRRIVSGDRVDHALRGDDWDVVARDELREARVVVRVGVREEHRL